MLSDFVHIFMREVINLPAPSFTIFRKYFQWLFSSSIEAGRKKMDKLIIYLEMTSRNANTKNEKSQISEKSRVLQEEKAKFVTQKNPNYFACSSREKNHLQFEESFWRKIKKKFFFHSWSFSLGQRRIHFGVWVCGVTRRFLCRG